MKEEKNKTRIKVGINASFLRKPNTGIGQVTLNFLKTLKKLEADKVSFVLYLEEELPSGINFPENFEKRIFLPIWKRDDLIRKIWWEKYSLPRQVKKDECDIFLSMYQCPTIFDSSIIHVIIVHDIIPKLFSEYLDNWRKKIYWKLTEKGIRKAEKIVAVSKCTEKDLINQLGIAGNKIATVYIDADEVYKKDVSLEESAKVLKKFDLKSGYILAGGGYEKRKNIEGVIRAYKILRERNKKEFFVDEIPDLVIYGKILPKNLKLATDAESLLKELNLTTQVKLLGMVEQKDMPAIFANASVFVYPSHYEGFGLPVLEAMNLGCSVVTSKISSLPEVGGDGVLYCDPKDTEDIAMIVKSVLTKKELRETLKARARSQAKKFSWDKFSKKIINIFSEI